MQPEVLEVLVESMPATKPGGVSIDSAAVPRIYAGRDTGTLLSLLATNAQSHGSGVAIRERDRGIWREFTWKEMLSEVVAVAAALDAMGFRPGEGLLVIGDNRPRLYFAMLSAAALKGAAAPIYPDVPPEELEYYAGNSRARFALAEDQEQVDKLLELRSCTGIPETIIFNDPRGLSQYRQPGLVSWTEMLERGREELAREPGRENDIIARAKPSDVAVLLHSSGTTGKPKGVPLQHRRVIAAARNAAAAGYFRPGDELMAYMPIAWVGDFVFTLSSGIALRFTANIPERQETILRDLREAAPTMYFASPRSWDAMLTHVQVRIAESTTLKRRLYEWLMPVAIRVERDRLAGRRAHFARMMMRALGEIAVYAPLRDYLGLSRAKNAYTAGEAIGEDTFLFFRALGIDLKQFYGQTENCALTAAQSTGDVKLNTVGKPLPGVETRIADDGEILLRADSVFDGYLNDDEASFKTLAGGWLHTGDAGYLDEDGHLVVLGRVGEVVHTKGGDRYIPNYIENRLKFSAYIKDAAVFGAGREDLTAFICIDGGAVGHWAERNGVTYTSYAELSQRSEVYRLVEETVRHVNELLPAGLAIRRFVNLPKEFDPDDGEVTRTRKLRRNVIEQRYAPVIAALYDGSSGVDYETLITYETGATGTLKRRLAIQVVR
jgi:long-chain acyl-CoA synthetase